MTGEWSQTASMLLWSGVATLLLLDLAFSVALSAAAGLSRVALHRMVAEGDPRLGFLERIGRPDSREGSAARILRQLCLIGALVLAALALRAAGWRQPELLAALVVGSIGVLLLENALALVVARWHPRVALRVAGPLLRAGHLLLYPIVEPLHLTLDRVGRAEALSDEEREVEQEQAVAALIEVGERDGLLEAVEGEMMRSIVDLDDTRVRELMTPRTDIVSLSVETSVAAARQTVLEAGHSRLPVYKETIDNVVGVLHARDLFRAWESHSEKESIAPYLRPPIFVPETLSAAELLADMRQKMHIALVVDEYGGVAGLITLEDVLEEIVGEIEDEHDEGQELVRQEDDGSWVINAVTHVEELESMFGIELGERDFDTVGGMVVAAFGRVPLSGEREEIRGLEVEILAADRRRVQRVRIRPTDSSDEAQAGR